MFNYPKALRLAGVGILLSLLWGGVWILSYTLVSNALLSSNMPFTHALFLMQAIVSNSSIWLSFIVAVFSLIWSFLRGKPHSAYAGLHVFCWMSFFGLALLTNAPILFVGPLVLSLLLFLLLQPILTSLSKLQGFVGVLVVDPSLRSAPKQAAEDPFSYEDGYKTVQSEAVYEEGERSYPYPGHDFEQSHIQYPQSSR